MQAAREAAAARYKGFMNGCKDFTWNDFHSLTLKTEFNDLSEIAQGDSGGALSVNGVIAGLVSRGGSDKCAKVNWTFCTFKVNCLSFRIMWLTSTLISLSS